MCKLEGPYYLIYIHLKRNAELIPQVTNQKWSIASEQKNHHVMDFVAIIPDEITCGAGSVKILKSRGAGLVDDVINGVKGHIHESIPPCF